MQQSQNKMMSDIPNKGPIPMPNHNPEGNEVKEVSYIKDGRGIICNKCNAPLDIGSKMKKGDLGNWEHNCEDDNGSK